MMNRESFIKGIRDGIPIGLGYFAVSFSFGMLAAAGGLSVGQATLLSLLNLTSAGQVAGLNLIIAGSSYLEMALTQLTINLRYCLMSFSISQKLERGVPQFHRYLVAFGITDEIFGVTASQAGRVSPWYSYGAMSMAIPGWTVGTMLGAVSGSLLPGFVTSALGIALYGMFLAVVIPPSRKSKAVAGLVLASFVASFAVSKLVPGLSSGMRTIVLTVVLCAAAAILFPVREEARDAA